MESMSVNTKCQYIHESGSFAAERMMPACGAGVELTNQTVDQAADFGEQLGVVAEGGALSSPS